MQWDGRWKWMDGLVDESGFGGWKTFWKSVEFSACWSMSLIFVNLIPEDVNVIFCLNSYVVFVRLWCWSIHSNQRTPSNPYSIAEREWWWVAWDVTLLACLFPYFSWNVIVLGMLAMLSIDQCWKKCSFPYEGSLNFPQFLTVFLLKKSWISLKCQSFPPDTLIFPGRSLLASQLVPPMSINCGIYWFITEHFGL